ncbi:hypothetical protein ACFLYU_00305 [Candidatus Dependentiae bacterium]
MKKLKLFVLLIFLGLFFKAYPKPDTSGIKHPLPFNKVIIWGHKLHSHTHSYIHYAFYKAFKHLGYETLWLDNKDDVSEIDFSNSLFLTEGQVDGKMPVRGDCRYILHNCKPDRYKQIFDTGNCIILQVYTHDCLDRNDKRIEKCMHIDTKNRVIYMPWATDLLPHEIDEIKKQVALEEKENFACYVGTISGHGQISNRNGIHRFSDACKSKGIPFRNRVKISPEESIRLIRTCFLAPAIQGPWQCEKGYVPCRIFKNISYGAIGITNSKTVYELFDKKILYNSDPYQLGLDAIEKMKQLDINELYELMDFVRDNHTYINRINYLFWFMDLFKPLF